MQQITISDSTIRGSIQKERKLLSLTPRLVLKKIAKKRRNTKKWGERFLFHASSFYTRLFPDCFSAHGLGTAALSAKEPEALPFCAIAYALTGIFGSLLCSVPAVRQSLLAVVG